MDAVELGVIISMIGVLAILVYAIVWFIKVINSDNDESGES